MDLMPKPTGKALTNEAEYPTIVELAVPRDGLDIELSRRIMEFHMSRFIQPRHGRIIHRGVQTYYRWCFSDLTTARAFIDQFGGTLSENYTGG
jgi:hypothetical protein